MAKQDGLGRVMRRLWVGGPPQTRSLLKDPQDLHPDPGHEAPSLALGPTSAYELVTRRGLDDLTRVVERLETKVNAMLGGMAIAVGLEIYRSLK